MMLQGTKAGIKTKTMSKLKISGKELRAIGYPEGPVISVAMNVMQKKLQASLKGGSYGTVESSVGITCELFR